MKSSLLSMLVGVMTVFGIGVTHGDVLYATDRQPVPRDDGTLAYGYGRSFSLAMGSCVVEIGQGVAWDTLVQQSRQTELKGQQPCNTRHGKH